MIPHARPRPREQEIEAVTRALRAGRLAQGQEVAALERDLSVLFDGAEVVAVSSGTAALLLALHALGVRRGSSLVLPSYTCNSLYAAASYAGAAVRLADTEADTLTIDAVSAGAVGATAAAIVAPHTYGFPADIAGLRSLGLPVIEDCAHALGGRCAEGARPGLAGDIAVLSLYATKLLPAGEGGACVTRRASLAREIRRLRNCDEQTPDPLAFNFKLSDLHAALARARLPALAGDHAERERIAARYDAVLGGVSLALQTGRLPVVRFGYVIRPGVDIARFIEAMEEAGIRCRRPVYRPLHETLGGDCPCTAAIHRDVVSLPLYPGLSEAEIDGIAAAASQQIRRL